MLSLFTLSIGIVLLLSPIIAFTTWKSIVIPGLIAYYLSKHLFNFGYAQWVQRQDLACDTFVVKYLGNKEYIEEMLAAISTTFGNPQHTLYQRIFQRLFGFTSIQQRIDAVNKL